MTLIGWLFLQVLSCWAEIFQWGGLEGFYNVKLKLKLYSSHMQSYRPVLFVEMDWFYKIRLNVYDVLNISNIICLLKKETEILLRFWSLFSHSFLSLLLVHSFILLVGIGVKVIIVLLLPLVIVWAW